MLEYTITKLPNYIKVEFHNDEYTKDYTLMIGKRQLLMDVFKNVNGILKKGLKPGPILHFHTSIHNVSELKKFAKEYSYIDILPCHNNKYTMYINSTKFNVDKLYMMFRLGGI